MSILNDLTGKQRDKITSKVKSAAITAAGAKVGDVLQDKLSGIIGKGSELLFGGGNIDTLKSAIGKHGGLARSNKFNVMFSPPGQSLLNLNRTDILESVLSGGFDMRQLINDPRDIAILCQRAQFPSWNISTFEYQANHQVNKFPYTYIHEDLTLTFLCTHDYYMKKMFDQWMNGILSVDGHVVNYKSNYAVDIVVQQLNNKFIPVYGYTFYKAYPIIVTAMELDAGSSDYVKLDVTFAYDSFNPAGLIGTAIDAIGAGLPEGLKDIVSTGFNNLNFPGSDALAQKPGKYSDAAKGLKDRLGF
jgi:hypothetical protein